MKRIFFFIILQVFVIYSVLSQEKNPDYNPTMAKSLDADEIGMHRYVIAFLKAGPVRLTDSIQRVELQQAHMKNITRLAKEGKLILAGPFLDNQSLRGIFIFDVPSVEEAQELTSTDPAIKAGTLVMELHPWYGSAALKKVPELHRQLHKNKY